jgi:trigger factor
MLRERYAEYAPVEGRPLAWGDYAVLDITGKIGGSGFDERKRAWLECKEETYLPGFCAHIIGMNAGEERAFTMVLPADFSTEKIRGKEVAFTVTLHEVKEKHLPDLSDDFCKQVGDFKGVNELKTAVRNDLLGYAEARENEAVVKQINDYLLGRFKFPIPQERLNDEAIDIAKKTLQQLAYQGWTEETIKQKKDELMKAARERAEENLKLAYIYSEIAKREGVTVAPAEVEERIKQLAERLKKDPLQVKAAMEKEGRLSALVAEMKSKKVVDFLVENAKIKSVERKKTAK